MPNYLILYRSTMTPAEQMAASTPEDMQASMEAWMAWGASAGDHLVEFGSPTLPTSDADPGPAGWIGGYSMMQADDLAQLDAVLAAHPHKEYGSIEVLELLPMPGS
jgi:muconolactone delta-isomerase